MQNVCGFKKKHYICSVLKLSAGIMTCHPCDGRFFVYLPQTRYSGVAPP
ncbi:TPA_asm: hypothetical protein [Porphyromonas phage phage023a_KCOM2797]|uniref:Uncharacterized protein n=1 Tax=Porphyromonas phage phage023a_KCOM2797 TaxID=3154113 RepID=A0AAT9J8W4_9CAUD